MDEPYVKPPLEDELGLGIREPKVIANPQSFNYDMLEAASPELIHPETHETQRRISGHELGIAAPTTEANSQNCDYDRVDAVSPDLIDLATHERSQRTSVHESEANRQNCDYDRADSISPELIDFEPRETHQCTFELEFGFRGAKTGASPQNCDYTTAPELVHLETYDNNEQSSEKLDLCELVTVTPHIDSDFANYYDGNSPKSSLVSCHHEIQNSIELDKLVVGCGVSTGRYSEVISSEKSNTIRDSCDIPSLLPGTQNIDVCASEENNLTALTNCKKDNFQPNGGSSDAALDFHPAETADTPTSESNSDLTMPQLSPDLKTRTHPEGVGFEGLKKVLPLFLSQQAAHKRNVSSNNKKESAKSATDLDESELEKLYQCEICGRKFRFNQNLKAHVKTHSGEKNFSCKVCKKSFSRNGNLTVHMRIHSGERTYKCTLCEKSFTNTTCLSRHIRSHTGEKRYGCNLCDKAYASSRDLVMHMHSHTGDRESKFKCSFCGKLFQHNSSLKVHVRTHTGSDMHTCDVCRKSFTRKSSLTVHLRMHTGERKYECPVCKKAFYDKACLRSHVAVHYGDKKYQCSVCGKSFAHSCSRSRHMRSHLKQNPVNEINSPAVPDPDLQ